VEEAAVKARTPLWVVLYQGRDITADLVPQLTSVTYTDELRERSDTLELQLEDRRGRWRGAWYPSRGDRIELRIGYEGARLLNCGAFRVDEVSFRGPPDTVTVSALAATMTRPLRTRRHRAWENVTVRELVEEIAAEEELTIVGRPPETRLRRVTQWGESVLAFLARVAGQHGYVCSIRGEQLVFVELAEIDKQAPAVTLTREHLIEYRLHHQTHRTYAAAEVEYFDPETRKHVSARAGAAAPTGRLAPSADVLRETVVARTAGEARRRAQSLLERANRRRVEGTLLLEGDPRLVAGSVLELAGMDGLSGRYSVRKSTHSISRSSGYETELEVRVA
jgi:phage protein D